MIEAFFVGNHDRARERERERERERWESEVENENDDCDRSDPWWRAAIHNQDLIWGGGDRRG